ncbi:MAG: hypothetical protein ILP19_08095 [Oscillospiraceae bacterium]|nr:hypothetical protein [Oscillospiraceae bacterium]
MKMKKFLAAAASVAVAASAMSVFSAGTSAIGSDKIDFEDGDLSFVYLNTDADACVKSGLTVTDHNGSKQLTLPVANGEWAKIWFDLDSIMPRESATQIMSVTMDIQAAPEAPGATVNWKGGALGAAGGFDRENMTGEGFQVNPDWSQGSQFEIGAYNPDEESPVAEAEIKFLLPSSRITLEGTNPFIAVQVWQASDNGYILYIDNVVFKDKDGNAIPLGGVAAVEEAAPAEEPAAEEAVEEVVVEEVVEEAAPVEEPVVVEAAPVVVEATPVAPTGNTSALAIVSIMAVAAAAAVASKRK